MKSNDRDAGFGSGWNRHRARDRRSQAANRRLFLEALEPRQMMAVFYPSAQLGAWAGNYLPPQAYRAATEGFLSAPASGDALTIALNYLRANSASMGLTAADLEPGNFVVSSRHTSAGSGITHIYLQRTLFGFPLADATINVSVMPDGRILAAGANFPRGVLLPLAPTPVVPVISAAEAVNFYAAAAGIADPNAAEAPGGGGQDKIVNAPNVSRDPIPAKLHYVSGANGSVTLGWNLTVRTPDGRFFHDVTIGATTQRRGQVLRVVDRVERASYNVFPPTVEDPSDGPRVLLTDPHDRVASPLGWHDVDGLPGPEFFDTRGNNVWAENPTVTPNGIFTPASTPLTNDFNYPLNLNFPNQPLSWEDAATTQLFYASNLAHDVTYRYGFDEAAGNFQITNYSRQGLGGDPVQAFAQSVDPLALLLGPFFALQPEGIAPEMHFPTFFINPFVPNRDTTLDNFIIFHEYFHGVTSRLTGGAANIFSLQALQPDAMSEGWSDWFALVMTIEPGDTKFTPRTTGEFTTGLLGGVRRQPYSFDMRVNPLTLDDFNGGFPNNQAHNGGEIWASALWDMTWLLIDKYGYDPNLHTGTGGNNVALNLVMNGLKLQPVNPSFRQARDAILAADFALYGGRNADQIWEAFARRGLGLSAADSFYSLSTGISDSTSPTVREAFDRPLTAGRVTGTVFHDVNGNGRRDSGEGSRADWIVYVDANNNGQRDSNEQFDRTDAGGHYELEFFGSQTVNVRQEPLSQWRQTHPTNSAAHRVSVARGEIDAGYDFGVQELGGEIRGQKWNDLDADAVRDPNEPGIGGVTIYVDVNNDGRIGVMEPAAVTDASGNYVIRNVAPGTYTVREIVTPGMVQTFPSPLAPFFGAHVVVVSVAGTAANIDFGNVQSLDFGDAPVSYGTVLANNGPRHGILANFQLGGTIDAEGNGQPSSDASGDGADEDGVSFIGGVVPGSSATVRVTVNAGSNPIGKLQAWIDFNRDGDFLDAGEQIVSNLFLGTGVHDIRFAVPSSAPLGPTFARFRYGYENNLGPLGASVAGEVEDYPISVLANVPVANADLFPRPGEPFIKQGSVDNVLDVLANDTGTTLGPARILPDSFPATLPSGSRLKLNAAGDRILFTPGPFSFGTETFTYQVTDDVLENGQPRRSAPALVTVRITTRDPVAVDDTVVVPFSLAPTETVIPALANDSFPFPRTQIVGVQKLSTSVFGDSIAIAPGGAALNFTPPAGFKGTIVYEYTINEVNPDDPTTAAAKGRVTVQVVDVTGGVAQPAPSHIAQMAVDVLDPNTLLPVTSVDVGGTFLVRVTARDLRPGGGATNRGVEAAYLDLIYDGDLAEPVLDPSNPLGFRIDFSSGPYGGTTGFARNGVPNSPAGGSIDEAGAAHADVQPVGPGTVTVFTVLMRAKAATASGQTFRVFGDPADVNAAGQDLSKIVLAADNPAVDPSPIEATDEEVFLRPSQPITIVAAGEGEFTNRANAYDVNGDLSVNPLDALTIINDLNSRGPRELSFADYVQDGAVLSYSYVDVNRDSRVAPLDALMIINHLNSLIASRGGAGGEGESVAFEAGEGESSGAAAVVAAVAADHSGLASLALTADPEEGDADLPICPLPQHDPAGGEPAALNAATPALSGTSEAPRLKSRLAKVDASAADELFAQAGGDSDGSHIPRSHARRLRR